MYLEFYALSDFPFRLVPDARMFFDSSTHRKALAYLTYGLHRGEGFIVITGEVGAGKSTLVDYLCTEVKSTGIVFGRIASTQLSAEDTLRMVAGAFGLSAAEPSKAALLNSLQGFLEEAAGEGRRAVLVIDEAQNLPFQALEELRMLSNFKSNGTLSMQIFLVGQPEFRTKIVLPELEQLRQRIVATYHLQPLQRDELRGYVEHRLRVCGWSDRPTIDAGMFDEIYDATGGIPRQINLLFDRLLVYGFLEEKTHLDPPLLHGVLEDMKQDALQRTEPAVAADVPDSAPQSKSAGRDEARAGGSRTAVQPPFSNDDRRAMRQALERLERCLRRQRNTMAHVLLSLEDGFQRPISEKRVVRQPTAPKFRSRRSSA